MKAYNLTCAARLTDETLELARRPDCTQIWSKCQNCNQSKTTLSPGCFNFTSPTTSRMWQTRTSQGWLEFHPPVPEYSRVNQHFPTLSHNRSNSAGYLWSNFSPIIITLSRHMTRWRRSTDRTNKLTLFRITRGSGGCRSRYFPSCILEREER